MSTVSSVTINTSYEDTAYHHYDHPHSNRSADADYYYSYAYEDFYYTDHLYQIFKFEVSLYGYVWPILVIITTCCNLLVIGGFLRKRMRTPTNLILVFIAISDSLTGLVTLPATFHIFPHENYALSKEWCETVMITRLFISRAFHTISVWETLLLAVHRYLQIRYPAMAQSFCTTPKTFVSVGVMYIASFLLHSYHAFDVKSKDGMCHWTLEDPCGWTCVYIWCTLILSHLLPCFALVLLAFGMIRSLRAKLQAGNTQNRANRRWSRHKKITLVVVFVVVIFLIPELPYGIFYLITVSLRHDRKRIFSLQTNRLIHCIYEIILVISFHLNFWVYCVMINSFRACIKGFIRLITCRPVNFERLDNDMTSSSGKDLELVGIAAESDSERISGQ